ncbi:Cysteine-rich protein 2-binding protein [Gonapodya sp. JEL0774]|nr:Cysteine-rich protein 2-binding protein [Gonapodya sp. JEL0774]
MDVSSSSDGSESENWDELEDELAERKEESDTDNGKNKSIAVRIPRARSKDVRRGSVDSDGSDLTEFEYSTSSSSSSEIEGGGQGGESNTELDILNAHSAPADTVVQGTGDDDAMDVEKTIHGPSAESVTGGGEDGNSRVNTAVAKSTQLTKKKMNIWTALPKRTSGRRAGGEGLSEQQMEGVAVLETTRLTVVAPSPIRHPPAATETFPPKVVSSLSETVASLIAARSKRNGVRSSPNPRGGVDGANGDVLLDTVMNGSEDEKDGANIVHIAPNFVPPVPSPVTGHSPPSLVPTAPSLTSLRRGKVMGSETGAHSDTVELDALSEGRLESVGEQNVEQKNVRSLRRINLRGLALEDVNVKAEEEADTAAATSATIAVDRDRPPLLSGLGKRVIGRDRRAMKALLSVPAANDLVTPGPLDPLSLASGQPFRSSASAIPAESLQLLVSTSSQAIDVLPPNCLAGSSPRPHSSSTVVESTADMVVTDFAFGNHTKFDLPVDDERVFPLARRDVAKKRGRFARSWKFVQLGELVMPGLDGLLDKSSEKPFISSLGDDVVSVPPLTEPISETRGDGGGVSGSEMKAQPTAVADSGERIMSDRKRGRHSKQVPMSESASLDQERNFVSDPEQEKALDVKASRVAKRKAVKGRAATSRGRITTTELSAGIKDVVGRESGAEDVTLQATTPHVGIPVTATSIPVTISTQRVSARRGRSRPPDPSVVEQEDVTTPVLIASDDLAPGFSVESPRKSTPTRTSTSWGQSRAVDDDLKTEVAVPVSSIVDELTPDADPSPRPASTRKNRSPSTESVNRDLQPSGMSAPRVSQASTIATSMFSARLGSSVPNNQSVKQRELSHVRVDLGASPTGSDSQRAGSVTPVDLAPQQHQLSRPSTPPEIVTDGAASPCISKDDTSEAETTPRLRPSDLELPLQDAAWNLSEESPNGGRQGFNSKDSDLSDQKLSKPKPALKVVSPSLSIETGKSDIDVQPASGLTTVELPRSPVPPKTSKKRQREDSPSTSTLLSASRVRHAEQLVASPSIISQQFEQEEMTHILNPPKTMPTRESDRVVAMDRVGMRTGNKRTSQSASSILEDISSNQRRATARRGTRTLASAGEDSVPSRQSIVEGPSATVASSLLALGIAAGILSGQSVSQIVHSGYSATPGLSTFGAIDKPEVSAQMNINVERDLPARILSNERVATQVPEGVAFGGGSSRIQKRDVVNLFDTGVNSLESDIAVNGVQLHNPPTVSQQRVLELLSSASRDLVVADSDKIAHQSGKEEGENNSLRAVHDLGSDEEKSKDTSGTEITSDFETSKREERHETLKGRVRGRGRVRGGRGRGIPRGRGKGGSRRRGRDDLDGSSEDEYHGPLRSDRFDDERSSVPATVSELSASEVSSQPSSDESDVLGRRRSRRVSRPPTRSNSPIAPARSSLRRKSATDPRYSELWSGDDEETRRHTPARSDGGNPVPESAEPEVQKMRIRQRSRAPSTGNETMASASLSTLRRPRAKRRVVDEDEADSVEETLINDGSRRVQTVKRDDTQSNSNNLERDGTPAAATETATPLMRSISKVEASLQESAMNTEAIAKEYVMETDDVISSTIVETEVLASGSILDTDIRASKSTMEKDLSESINNSIGSRRTTIQRGGIRKAWRGANPGTSGNLGKSVNNPSGTIDTQDSADLGWIVTQSSSIVPSVTANSSRLQVNSVPTINNREIQTQHPLRTENPQFPAQGATYARIPLIQPSDHPNFSIFGQNNAMYNSTVTGLIASLPTQHSRQVLLEGLSNGSIQYQFLPQVHAYSTSAGVAPGVQTLSEPGQGRRSGAFTQNAQGEVGQLQNVRLRLSHAEVANTPSIALRGRGLGRGTRGNSSQSVGRVSTVTTANRFVQVPAPSSVPGTPHESVTTTAEGADLQKKRKRPNDTPNQLETVILEPSDGQTQETKKQKQLLEIDPNVDDFPSGHGRASGSKLPTVIEYSEASSSESEADIASIPRKSRLANEVLYIGQVMTSAMGSKRRDSRMESNQFDGGVSSSWRQSNGASLRHELYGRPPEPLLSRISPYTGRSLKPLIFQDMETVSPHAQLLEDVILKAGGEPRERKPLQFLYLDQKWVIQCNWMLSNIFWSGIDVGCALMNPQGYISYVGVLPGWEKCGIGRVMLWWLIQTVKPHDITLHVQTKNPAMILYQEFGFKAEEFIVGFYNKYIPASNFTGENNAYFMRRRGR